MSTSILTLNHVEFITKLLSLEVSKGAKMLLMALKIDDGKVPISTKILAEKLRCSPRSVQRYLKELVEKGLRGALKDASPALRERPILTLDRAIQKSGEGELTSAQKTTLTLDPFPASGRGVDMIEASALRPTPRPESSLEKYAKMTPEQRIEYEMRDYVPLDPMSEAVVEKAVENAIKAGRRVKDGMPKEIEDYIDYISVVEKRPGFFGLSFAVDRQYKKRLDMYYRAYEFVLELPKK